MPFPLLGALENSQVREDWVILLGFLISWELSPTVMFQIFIRRLPPDVKVKNTQREEPVCQDEPQDRLTMLGKSKKTTPAIPTPKILRNPCGKGSKQA